MDELLNPEAPFQAEERVLMTMELGEDIRSKMEIHQGQQTLWDSELAPTQEKYFSCIMEFSLIFD